ncbi:hypothetical protein Q31b_42330 [Novipirellula aureliae]|uniref:Uncharacterized protein n=1 Tax=Novipirellula aureliae TaxID=2527966 RepID=A0A5C6DQW1_9BACT|nr:hypothetical protein [Novipirellula aureliae]TWU39148.1 hypothetical protein Q31b_42330 [Novipirellula aureliae]
MTQIQCDGSPLSVVANSKGKGQGEKAMLTEAQARSIAALLLSLPKHPTKKRLAVVSKTSRDRLPCSRKLSEV